MTDGRWLSILIAIFLLGGCQPEPSTWDVRAGSSASMGGDARGPLVLIPEPLAPDPRLVREANSPEALPPKGRWCSLDRLFAGCESPELVVGSQCGCNSYQGSLSGRVVATEAAMLLPRVEKNFTMVPVFFGTDRQGTGIGRPRPFFDGQWQDQMRYGVAYVSIPGSHVTGKVERPFEFLNIRFREDARAHVYLHSVSIQEEETFFATVNARLNAQSSKNALVFVHGYNVPFEDAVMRTAQIAYEVARVIRTG